MLRLTLLRTRTPGKLLHIWRTSRIGRALPGPAFVLVDIFFGDKVYRNQDKRLIGLLAVKNIVSHFNGFLRHHVGGCAALHAIKLSLSFKYGTTSGAPSTLAIKKSLRCACLAARSQPIDAGSLIENTASIFGNAVNRSVITRRPSSRLPLAF